MEYIETQFLQTMAWLLRDHATIVSEHYKTRQTQRGSSDEEISSGAPKWRDCTNEEKLANAIGTMTSRCLQLEEIATDIYKKNKGKED